MEKNRTSRAKAILSIAMGILLVQTMAEILFRSLDLFPPRPYRYDPDLGAVFIPGYRGRASEEGEAWLEINFDGLRDVEHSIGKPRGVFRIAVLGDSVVEASQVPLGDTFHKRMESELKSCVKFKSRTVETLNFGVGGYGTAEELLILKRKVWKYDPDLILLMITPGNDLLDNLRPVRQAILDPLHYRSPSKASVIFRHTMDTLAQKSRVASVLVRAGQLAKVGIKSVFANSTSQNRQVLPESFLLEEDMLKNEVLLPPKNVFWNQAWETTERLLDLFAEEVRAHQKALLFVTDNTSLQVFPISAERKKAMAIIGAQDLFYPDHRLERFSAERGISVLVLAPKLLAFAEKNGDYFQGFPNTRLGIGHWNVLGHRVVSELISEKICQMEWPESRKVIQLPQKNGR